MDIKCLLTCYKGMQKVKKKVKAYIILLACNLEVLKYVINDKIVKISVCDKTLNSGNDFRNCNV